MRIDEYPVLKHFDKIVSTHDGPPRALIAQTRDEIVMLLEEHVRLNEEIRDLKRNASVVELSKRVDALEKSIVDLAVEQSNADR